jgi:uncharacterized protein YggE
MGVKRQRALICFMLGIVGLLSASPARAQTMLTLSATGQADAKPDQVTATLTAQVASTNPVIAQNGVNATVGYALKLAKTMPGLTVTTANYSVTQEQSDNGNGPMKYDASDDVTLVEPAVGGIPTESFSTLLGKLQSRGLLLENFDGSLSATASDQAMQNAIADAMRQIHSQAQAVATPLNETVGQVTKIELNDNMPGPVPMAQRMMAMASVAAPQAAPSAITVQASVTATMALVAK